MCGAHGNTGCGPMRGAKRGGQQLTAAFASFRAERGKRLFISHFVPPISLSPCEPCNRMYSVTCITRCGCAPTSSPHQTRHVFPCGVAIIV